MTRETRAEAMARIRLLLVSDDCKVLSLKQTDYLVFGIGIDRHTGDLVVRIAQLDQTTENRRKGLQ